MLLHLFLHKIRIKRNSKRQKYPPSKIGEYYIVRKGRIFYIGKSVSLNRRMKEHLESGKLRKGDIFYYRIARWGASQDALADHECKMIAKYKPPGNKSKGGEGRMKNNAKYWLISGGLQVLLIRIIVILLVTLVILWMLDKYNLSPLLITKIQSFL